jgi:hypothetical protein
MAHTCAGRPAGRVSAEPPDHHVNDVSFRLLDRLGDEEARSITRHRNLASACGREGRRRVVLHQQHGIDERAVAQPRE